MTQHKIVLAPHGKGGRCALSPEEERAVYRRVMANEISQRKIAKELGVHRNTIANILARLKSEGTAPAALSSEPGKGLSPDSGRLPE